jgi:hypothetical protein
VEATAMGNLLIQVRASGELSSLAEMRAFIRKSSDVGRFTPKNASAWQEGIGRFQNLRSRVSKERGPSGDSIDPVLTPTPSRPPTSNIQSTNPAVFRGWALDVGCFL